MIRVRRKSLRWRKIRDETSGWPRPEPSFGAGPASKLIPYTSPWHASEPCWSTRVTVCGTSVTVAGKFVRHRDHKARESEPDGTQCESQKKTQFVSGIARFLAEKLVPGAGDACRRE